MFVRFCRVLKRIAGGREVLILFFRLIFTLPVYSFLSSVKACIWKFARNCI